MNFHREFIHFTKNLIGYIIKKNYNGGMYYEESSSWNEWWSG